MATAWRLHLAMWSNIWAPSIRILFGIGISHEHNWIAARQQREEMKRHITVQLGAALKHPANQAILDERTPTERRVDAFVAYFGSLKFIARMISVIVVWIMLNNFAWTFRWDPWGRMGDLLGERGDVAEARADCQEGHRYQ